MVEGGRIHRRNHAGVRVWWCQTSRAHLGVNYPFVRGPWPRSLPQRNFLEEGVVCDCRGCGLVLDHVVPTRRQHHPSRHGQDCTGLSSEVGAKTPPSSFALILEQNSSLQTWLADPLADVRHSWSEAGARWLDVLPGPPSRVPREHCSLYCVSRLVSEFEEWVDRVEVALVVFPPPRSGSS